MFLYFPRCGFRQFAHKVYARRNLERSEALYARFLYAARVIVLSHDNGNHFFPGKSVRNSYHGDLAHFFYFFGTYIDTASDDDILFSVRDKQVLVEVDIPYVACIERPIAEGARRFLRIVEIVRGHIVAPYHDLPGYSGRARAPLLINVSDTAAGYSPAGSFGIWQ